MTAAPALAGPGDPVDCIPPVPSPGGPTQTIVRVQGLDVTINPGGSVRPGDTQGFAVDVLLAALGYVGCVEGDTADPITCLQPLSDYVQVDTETGGVSINGNELAARVDSCLAS